MSITGGVAFLQVTGSRSAQLEASTAHRCRSSLKERAVSKEGWALFLAFRSVSGHAKLGPALSQVWAGLGPWCGLVPGRGHPG